MTDIDKNYGMNTLYPSNSSELNARDVFFSWYSCGEAYDYDNDTTMQRSASKYIIHFCTLLNILKLLVNCLFLY